ncbi:NAD(P)-dependent alcohol dehydrogenase [Tropicimonas sediminicola]|uniref:NADPH:quinone reductase n=1 Tax=Tropicimonas sediminicola TaxID=1031541 RepID=A0A239EAL6_9RHOB|nr:NAD(P)-dependent alcohol dehydrogenase [Tropicimonas sediminicola]SNS41676.1 NADPH:quinone reductase [Tropicimonas sediminicola]
MKAVVYRNYGGPEVLSLAEVPFPVPGEREVVVEVVAGSVTTGDWRLRAAAFPPPFRLIGRLMFGLCRPRKTVLGGEFAGRVVAVGSRVTHFQKGDEVFGFSAFGAHAERVLLPEDGAIVHKPADLGFHEAAALPFGATSALVFLRDFAEVRPGESVLVLGASGGVGAYAVQIARALGARVTGVCSAAHADFVAGLGAERVIDYRAEDFAASGESWDVVLDTIGVTTLAKARPALTQEGRFVPLNMGARDILHALTNRFRRGPSVRVGVNEDRREYLEDLLAMIAAGQLRPVIDTIYPLEQIRAAYRHVESRHRAGAIVLDVEGSLTDAEELAA